MLDLCVVPFGVLHVTDVAFAVGAAPVLLVPQVAPQIGVFDECAEFLTPPPMGTEVCRN